MTHFFVSNKAGKQINKLNLKIITQKTVIMHNDTDNKS